MPKHTEMRQLPYTAQQIYDLVADIEAYPQFLPWCAAARIRDRKAEFENERIAADLVISFKVFRERFGSDVLLQPQDMRIDIDYLDGPFKYLNSYWIMVANEDGCELKFEVDFEFKNMILQGLIGAVFDEAMRRIVRAFEARAKELYG